MRVVSAVRGAESAGHPQHAERRVSAQEVPPLASGVRRQSATSPSPQRCCCCAAPHQPAPSGSASACLERPFQRRRLLRGIWGALHARHHAAPSREGHPRVLRCRTPAIPGAFAEGLSLQSWLLPAARLPLCRIALCECPKLLPVKAPAYCYLVPTPASAPARINSS